MDGHHAPRRAPEGPSPDGPGMHPSIELNRNGYFGMQRQPPFRPVRRQALRNVVHAARSVGTGPSLRPNRSTKRLKPRVPTNEPGENLNRTLRMGHEAHDVTGLIRDTGDSVTRSVHI